MQRWRAGIALGASFFLGAVLAIGCGDDVVVLVQPDAGTDASAPSADDDDSDPPAEADAGKDAGKADAGKPKNQRDAAGPGGDAAACSFNWDCQLGLRCECNGECQCNPGKRGEGKPGGGCEDGNDCISAVCLEGPNDELLCSDGCKVAADCPTNLPRCEDVALVGRVCVRVPPQ